VRQCARTRRAGLILAAGLLAAMTSLGQVVSAESGVTLEGIVIAADGGAVEGAVVALEGIGSLNTNAGGIFVFHNVPPGNYRLTVYKERFPDEKRLISVQAGRLNKVRVVLAGTAPLAPPSAPISVPIVQQGPALLVRGRVNEQVETLFLVDTGASLCVLTRPAAERLGLTSIPGARTVTIHTASGTLEAPLLRVDLIQVGAAEARSVEVLIHDIPGLPSEVGGLLGLSFLNQFTVQIDAARGVMLLTR